MSRLIRISAFILLATAIIGSVYADVYLHTPRGGNNRLDDNNRDRDNANRLWDSQNNNRGGSNRGSTGKMYYFTGTQVPVEWTNQHSCGPDSAKGHCEIILQYACQDLVRDGSTSNRIPDDVTTCTQGTNNNCSLDFRYGMHETYDSYQSCKWRSRNKGLFISSQNLQGDGAIYTRQNANGNRFGYECPEERDYYPYWHPTTWRDIAILTNDVSRCPAYQAESQNVKSRFWCDIPQYILDRKIAAAGTNAANVMDGYIPITKLECERTSVGGTWREWPSWNVAPPVCNATSYNRDNQNGNTYGGFPNGFNWTVPADWTHERCVFRLRYNISTNEFATGGFDTATGVKSNEDYTDNSAIPTNAGVAAELDVWTKYGLTRLDSKASFEATPTTTAPNNRGYALEQNPITDIFGAKLGVYTTSGAPIIGLQLAIDTSQFGRTFSDRSHMFAIRPRPAALANAVIHNLSVQGKRGNIVQTYPGTEYQFQPNRLEINLGDFVHFQWTGSNTSPAGAGEGPENYDRSNLVAIVNQKGLDTTLSSTTYPYDEGQPKTGLLIPPATGALRTIGQWGRVYPAHLDDDTVGLMGLSRADRARLATAGLEAAYFDSGPLQATESGIYHYLSTRNNNFSNRDQKGKIIVRPTAAQGGTATLSLPISERSTYTSASMMVAGSNYIEINDRALTTAEGATVAQQVASQVPTTTDAIQVEYVGSSTYSDVIRVTPDTFTLTGDKQVLLKMKWAAMGLTYPMFSRDSLSYPYENEEIKGTNDGGIASASITRGGQYKIVRTPNGGYIALLLIAIIIVVWGSGWFYYDRKVRKNPKKWVKAKKLCGADPVTGECCMGILLFGTRGGRSNKIQPGDATSEKGASGTGTVAKAAFESKEETAAQLAQANAAANLRRRKARAAKEAKEQARLADPLDDEMALQALWLPPAPVAKPKTETRFGAWATNMAMLNGLVAILLGVCGIAWGSVTYSAEAQETTGATLYTPGWNTWMALGAGIYSLILGPIVFLWEWSRGQHERDGGRFPTRAVIYAVLAAPLCISQVTLVAGIFFGVVAAVQLLATLLREITKPPPVRRPSPQATVTVDKAKASVAAAAATESAKAKSKPVVPDEKEGKEEAGKGTKEEGKKEEGKKEVTVKIPEKPAGDIVVLEDEEQVGIFEHVRRAIVMAYKQNKFGEIFFIFMYIAANCIIFGVVLNDWIGKVAALDATARPSAFAPYAKAFGNLLDFNCSIILLPVLRTILRWLYNKSTADHGCVAKTIRVILKVVPLDGNILFHKIIAKMILFSVCGHMFFHFFNYAYRPGQTLALFGTWPWISGGMICLCMLFIYGAVRENVKMGQFEIFWYAHHFFVLYFVLLLTHGKGGFGKNFWKWFVGPGVLYIAERILRLMRANQDVVLLSAIYMKPNVFSLEFAKEGVFKDGYSEGQYLFICCPKIAWLQWHPFTISSAPQENKVTIHIRVLGPGSWTRELCDYITAMGPKDASFFEFYRMGPNGRIPGKIEGPDGGRLFQIDGPHSAPTQHIGEYETVMIIGGGIGVTPVSSTLKSILYHRWKISQGKCYPSAAYFYWVVAYDDIDAFRWLLRSIKDASDDVAHNTARDPAGMAGKRFEFHIWVTSAPTVKPGAPHVLDEIDDADDYGFWGAPPVDTVVQKTEAPFTALDLYASMKRPPAHIAHGPVHIYSGRPKWGPAFAAVSKAHPDGDIGVAFCGNPIIAADLGANCYTYSKDRTKGIFKLHKENF